MPGAAGVVLLLALLTWLLLRGIETNSGGYAATHQAFDNFAFAEASLHRDVMQARAGLLGNYDTFGNALEAMEDAAAQLRSHARTEGLGTEPVDRLATTIGRQEELTERFKSSNAVLQNSLSYVGLLSTNPTLGAQAKQLAPAIGALAAAILHLTRDSSPESVKALEVQIDRFAAQAPVAGRHAEAAQALLAHARLLHHLLPDVDETLKTLVAVPSREPLEAVQTQFSNHHSLVEATAQRFRLLLYLVSLLLLVLLAHLGLQLRARAHALRRRAALEHIVAKNSTHLINCPPAETEARLKQVLGEFCRAIDGARAYVVFAENPIRVVAWSADGIAYPPGWPDQALAVTAQLGTARTGIVTVPDVAALPPGDTKDVLAAAGVRGWACVPLVRPGRARGIMAFDIFKPAGRIDCPESVARLASDAVANAIEREFLERERARLTTRLERARRMQMIGSIASGIAHNFNNIIGAILGYSEMIEPHVTAGSKPAQHIDEIRRAAERARSLIDAILTFGRRGGAPVRLVQVRDLFEEATSLLRASQPASVKLIVGDVPAGLALSGEPAQLQQVILNLGTNAAQAMEGGGSIHLTAEQMNVAAPFPLSHGKLAPRSYVCLSVSDTGHGFDDRVARRLFEPFFTTRLGGTGLGLATVHEIVRDHGGAMNVRSKPGSGSRFEAWLPAVAADNTTMADQAMPPLGDGKAVLVVESERERLLRDEEMLAALGYEPVGFERPADAIVACRVSPARFDAAVISDEVSEPDGLQLARALHEFMPGRPILFAARPTTDVSPDALAEAGIAEVLSRPFVSSELAAALARCLRPPDMLRT
ncbi:MAG TPA: two-component system VirA-like sensor kinase [Methylocella sp.]|nr:two-component system VirA-like sensor kinase [Methylocella sp.]